MKSVTPRHNFQKPRWIDIWCIKCKLVFLLPLPYRKRESTLSCFVSVIGMPFEWSELIYGSGKKILGYLTMVEGNAHALVCVLVPPMGMTKENWEEYRHKLLEFGISSCIITYPGQGERAEEFFSWEETAKNLTEVETTLRERGYELMREGHSLGSIALIKHLMTTTDFITWLLLVTPVSSLDHVISENIQKLWASNTQQMKEQVLMGYGNQHGVNIDPLVVWDLLAQDITPSVMKIVLDLIEQQRFSYPWPFVYRSGEDKYVSQDDQKLLQNGYLDTITFDASGEYFGHELTSEISLQMPGLVHEYYKKVANEQLVRL